MCLPFYLTVSSLPLDFFFRTVYTQFAALGTNSLGLEDLLTGFNAGNTSIDGIDRSIATDSNGLNPGTARVSTVPFSVDAFLDDSLMQ